MLCRTVIFTEKRLSLMTITRERQPDHSGREDHRRGDTCVRQRSHAGLWAVCGLDAGGGIVGQSPHRSVRALMLSGSISGGEVSEPVYFVLDLFNFAPLCDIPFVFDHFQLLIAACNGSIIVSLDFIDVRRCDLSIAVFG